MSINIGGVENFSLVDYPGQIAAVIFMQGCPRRCPFCYNSSLQEVNRESGFLWPKFIEFLQSRRGKLDAVVFSGGDPLVQDGLEGAVKEVRALGYKIGLHTGGYRPEHLKKVLPLLDWVGLDIKAPWNKYTQAVGCPVKVENVQKSLNLLLESGIDFECRTTCDPRLLENEDVRKIGNFLHEAGVKKYFLQKYRPVPGDLTQDWECEKFFDDAALIKELKEKFPIFEIRK